jgi:hypothetical protein
MASIGIGGLPGIECSSNDMAYGLDFVRLTVISCHVCLEEQWQVQLHH